MREVQNKDTSYALPKTSNHASIMRTRCFMDAQTGQVKWFTASLTPFGTWKFTRFETDILCQDDVNAHSLPDKQTADYGEALRKMAMYDRLYDNSDLGFVPVEDMLHVKPVPYFIESGNKDLVIFDKEGNPYPTHKGQVITDGSFSREQMNIVAAYADEVLIEKPTNSTMLSTQFNLNGSLMVAPTAVSELGKSWYCIITFLEEISAISKYDNISYTAAGIGGATVHCSSSSSREDSWHIKPDYAEKIIMQLFGSFDQLKQSESGIWADVKDYLLQLRLMYSMQVIHSVFDSEKKRISFDRTWNTVLFLFADVAEKGDLSALARVRERIERAERKEMDAWIKKNWPQKISRQEREKIVKTMIDLAKRPDFDKFREEFCMRGTELVRVLGESLQQTKQAAQENTAVRPNARTLGFGVQT